MLPSSFLVEPTLVEVVVVKEVVDTVVLVVVVESVVVVTKLFVVVTSDLLGDVSASFVP